MLSKVWQFLTSRYSADDPIALSIYEKEREQAISLAEQELNVIKESERTLRSA